MVVARFRTSFERDESRLVFTRVLHPIEIGREETHEVLSVREDWNQRVELICQPEIREVYVEEGCCENTALNHRTKVKHATIQTGCG